MYTKGEKVLKLLPQHFTNNASLNPVRLSIRESETSDHSTKRESSEETSGGEIVADEFASILRSICRLNSSVCSGRSEAAMERKNPSMAAGGAVK